MAREEMAKQGSDRRRSRAGLNLNVNFNGGVVLLLGAAAGALLASAFASHRIRAHKRRRGLMKEGIQEDSSEHLASHGAKEFVGDEGGERDGEGVSQVIVRKKSVHISLPKKQEIWFKICYFQVNSHDNLDARVQISQVDQREIEFCLLEEGKGEVAERNSTIDAELVDGERGELAGLRESGANISSSPRNTCHNLGEIQLMYDDQELVAASVKEEYKTSFVNCKEDDDEDNKKAYIEEWDKKEEIYEKMNSSDLHSEQPILLEKKISKNLEMVMAIEERNFEDCLKDEMYNSILEFVISKAKELATSTPGDQDEMNSLIEEIEPFFEASGEAKKALDITQNDSGKHPEMVIMEDKIRMENGGFKDDERLDTLHVKQDKEEGDASDEKMVGGSRDLREQTITLPHYSSFTAISEPEKNSCNDLVMVKSKEDFQLIDLINGIMHMEEDKEGVEVSNYPSTNQGIERLIDEIQGTENCTHEHPAMIIAVEEKTRLEENRTCNLNDGFQEEKTEENLSNGFKENVESSEAEENHKENEECPLTESQRIELSLEQDDLMAYKESPLIQFQGIQPIVREEKACLDDRFPISIESNMKLVQSIQDNNLNNSEKTLGIEESHMEAGAEGLETSPIEEIEEREDEAISVQYHELETRQHIAAHKGEIECPQILPVVKNAEAEIHKESKARIKEKEDEEEKNLKVSFDLVEKGVKTVAKTVKQDTKTGLIDVDDKHQRQVDGHENTVSSKGKQQRIATKKVKGTEYMFMGYTKCHIFLLTTVATAIAVLAFLYTKAFLTRTAILENFITS